MKNIVIISADRCGSTALQQHILGNNLNNDSMVWLGECFNTKMSQNVPYNPEKYPPKSVINSINQGTGKNVIVKILLTYSNYDNRFLEIKSDQNIFFHRNLFDSSLSRAIAQQTGTWFRFQHTPETTVEKIEIPVEVFEEKLEWRLSCYGNHIDDIIKWHNIFYRYENFNFNKKVNIRKNPDKEKQIINYAELKEAYKNYKVFIDQIEEKISKCKEFIL